MSDDGKQHWKDKAKARKDVCDEYAASPEGVAALADYKKRVKEAKEGAKGDQGAAAQDALSFASANF